MWPVDNHDLKGVQNERGMGGLGGLKEGLTKMQQKSTYQIPMQENNCLKQPQMSN